MLACLAGPLRRNMGLDMAPASRTSRRSPVCQQATARAVAFSSTVKTAVMGVRKQRGVRSSADGHIQCEGGGRGGAVAYLETRGVGKGHSFRKGVHHAVATTDPCPFEAPKRGNVGQ